MNSLSWSYQEAQKLLLGNVSHALSLDLFFVLKQIASNLPQSRYFCPPFVTGNFGNQRS
jgi:hypothetical protein